MSEASRRPDVSSVDRDSPDDKDVERDDGQTPDGVVRHPHEAGERAEARHDDGDGPRPDGALQEGEPGKGHDDAEDQVNPAPRGDVELEDVLLAKDEERVVHEGHEALEGVEDPGHDHEDCRENGHADGAGADLSLSGAPTCGGTGCHDLPPS